MSNVFLKGLSLAGLCWLALASVPSSRANDACPTCPQQTCPQQGQSCPGYCRTGCDDCYLKAIEKWALCPGYYILPPDYGFNTPVKVPVVRRGVTYYRYYPEQWYGTGSPPAGKYRSYPQVYSPTDTTQLGYTYQQVPYWQPANRLPPPLVPAQWHVREGHRGYQGRWHDCYTPIHHHQTSNVQYWVEPMGNRAWAPPAPARPAGPVGCPPTPSLSPSAEPNPAPNKLVPAPAVPAPPATPTPVPAPPAEGKTASKTKSRVMSMLWPK